MADIRGLPLTDQFQRQGRLLALAGIPAGFTVGQHYHALGLAIDCTPVPPVAYVVTVDDAGALSAVLASRFRFELYPDA